MNTKTKSIISQVEKLRAGLDHRPFNSNNDNHQQFLISLLNEVEKEMAETVRSGYFILGGQVSRLEERMANYCQTKYAVGVSSGTDALLIALMALGVGPGDEVITSPYTFFATAGSIVRVGAKPVFADINDITFNIKPEHIERFITSKTKAIIPVHLYGQCADMDPIRQLAKKNGLAVIAEAAGQPRQVRKYHITEADLPRAPICLQDTDISEAEIPPPQL